MTDQTFVQASLMKISLNRLETLRALGVPFDQFNLFKRFNDEELQEISSLDNLSLNELLLLAQNTKRGISGIKTFLELQEYGVSYTKFDELKSGEDILHGLKAGLSLEEATGVVDSGLWMRSAIKARDTGVEFSDLYQVHSLRRNDVDAYIDARSNGYSHEELIAVVAESPEAYAGFSIGEYRKARSTGITFEQIMEMLTHVKIDDRGRSYYLDLVTHSNKVSHTEACEVVSTGMYHEDYLFARSRGMNHEQIMQVVGMKMRRDRLKEHAHFLRENCRISHDEVFQYWQLTDHGLIGINRYIKLLDAGYQFDEIKAAHDAGVRVWVFGELRNAPIQATQEEILAIRTLGITDTAYLDLRERGIDHNTIVESVQSLRAP